MRAKLQGGKAKAPPVATTWATTWAHDKELSDYLGRLNKGYKMGHHHFLIKGVVRKRASSYYVQT